MFLFLGDWFSIGESVEFIALKYKVEIMPRSFCYLAISKSALPTLCFNQSKCNNSHRLISFVHFDTRQG